MRAGARRGAAQVRARLADVYAKMGKLDLALGEYNAALALDGSLESAQRGAGPACCLAAATMLLCCYAALPCGSRVRCCSNARALRMLVGLIAALGAGVTCVIVAAGRAGPS